MHGLSVREATMPSIGISVGSGDYRGVATFDTIEAGVAQLKAIIDDAEER
jgi:hypothetical protein